MIEGEEWVNVPPLLLTMSNSLSRHQRDKEGSKSQMTSSTYEKRRWDIGILDGHFSADFLPLLLHYHLKSTNHDLVVMVPHIFNPKTWEAEAAYLCELKASLVYRAKSRTARTTQRNPTSTKQGKHSVKRSQFFSVMRQALIQGNHILTSAET